MTTASQPNCGRTGGMAEIFISYKSERRKAAEHLAAVMAHYGYSVWFDYQLVKGRDFGLQIDRQIREAKALVVLWCSLSVGSTNRGGRVTTIVIVRKNGAVALGADTLI